MLKIGNIVDWKSRATPNGFPVSMGLGELLRPIGTVADFWELIDLASGRIIKAFVYEEDLVEQQPKPKLYIVKG